MILTPLSLSGCFLVEPERIGDERGDFGRVFCRAEFTRYGLDPHVEQCSVGRNLHAHTLRGLHWQRAPHEEAKLVRVTRGAVFDVLADVRPGSPTWGQWWGMELDAEGGAAVYAAPGVAHGFLTLVDHTELHYQMSTPYHAESACGARWDDPLLGIEWPARPRVISERDRDWPDLVPPA